MHEKLVAIGDDYWIENEEGNREFYVDGKAFRLRNTLILKDAQGRDLYKIQELLLKLRDTMDIKRADDGMQQLKKLSLISYGTLGKLKFQMDLGWKFGEIFWIMSIELMLKGNALQKSQKWFHIRDAYGVEIEPGQNNALILAIAAALDQMAHEE